MLLLLTHNEHPLLELLAPPQRWGSNTLDPTNVLTFSLLAKKRLSHKIGTRETRLSFWPQLDCFPSSVFFAQKLSLASALLPLLQQLACNPIVPLNNALKHVEQLYAYISEYTPVRSALLV